MDCEAIIELVPRRSRREAIRFVAGGYRRDTVTDVRADVLAGVVKSQGSSCRLWWSRRGRKCLAAAMISENPGRTALLLQSPHDARGVDETALVELLRAACTASLEANIAFVQAMVDPENPAETDVLVRAGFEKLAELLFMRLDLSSRVAPDSAAKNPALAWRNYGQFDEAELGRVIESTYVDSCDCPRLCSLRDIAEVIAGHKSGGLARPDAWWIVDVDGVAAGCILVNDYAQSLSGDVAYLGVVPASRGMGLSREMLRRSAEKARKRGLKSLTLAVDADNLFARRVYDSEGFEELHRRLAYVFSRGD